MAQTEEKLTIPCGAIRLEGVIRKNDSARGSAVITHPHPMLGGDMENPVVRQIEAALHDAGFTTLRFNFRGTGRSTGRFDEGDGEQGDVEACLAFLEERFSLPVVLAGYSFGAWVNARVLDAGRRVQEHIMVSPPVAFISFSDIFHIPLTRLVVTGERDDIAPPHKVQSMMDRCGISGRLDIIPDGDHFYARGGLDALYRILHRHLSR